MTFFNTISGLTSIMLMAEVALAQAPVPPAAPPQPAAAEAPVEPAVVDPNTMINERIEQPLMSGEMIAAFYREWTGKRVITSKAAQAIEISFIHDAPLTYRQATDLLVKTAFLEGLVFVPSGFNEVKLLPAPNVRKAGGYPLVTDPLLLPEGEELVSYVMALNNIKPEEAITIFNSYVASLDPHGVIIPVANANALLITENSQLIKTLIKLKERIDIPQELSTQKWITLDYADAEETAESVKSIMEFSSQQNTKLSAGGGGAAAPPAGNTGGNNAAGGARTTGGEKLSSVQVLSDSRTNRIFVIGRPIDVEVAEQLVSGFDAPLDKRNFFKHKLKFLSVSDFLPIAQNAITLASSKGSDNAQANGGRGNRTNNRTNRGSSRNNGGTNTGGGGGSGGSGLGESTRTEEPEALIVGKTMLVADNSNNTLIIKGPPQSISVVKDLIKEMDVASEQIQITAIFGRYNLVDDLTFGMDFARTYQATRGASSGFAGQSRTGTLLVDALTRDTVGSFTGAGTGFSIYGKIGDHFNATLSAMEKNDKFKLLARPTVFTTNNRKATLKSGQQIAVPTNTFTQGGSGTNSSQSTNISYRDVLLELEVIPLVNSSDEVTLQISFINNNAVGTTDIGDDLSVPLIGQETITTTVTVPDGETIMLGGLITEEYTDNITGVPVLKNIPGVKHLFSSVEKGVDRKELIIFIQPRIVNGRASLMSLQDENGENSKLIRNVRSGQGVLPPKYSEGNSIEQPKKKRRTFLNLGKLRKKAEAEAESKKRNTFKGIRR